MASRAQIERLRTRIETLAANAKVNSCPDATKDSPREWLMRRLQAIHERLRGAAEEMGEPFPPPHSREEHDDIARRVRELVRQQSP